MEPVKPTKARAWPRAARYAVMEREAEIERLREENQTLLETFRHTHVAKYDGEKLLDECAQCGLDLRNLIHRRVVREEVSDGPDPNLP